MMVGSLGGDKKPKNPVLHPPYRVSNCPHCGRVFEPSVLYCPYCEKPTRLGTG